MINSLITAFVLGLIGGAVPGPILTSIFTEILQSGLARGFRIVFIGMLAESSIAFLCIIAIASLKLPESVFRLLSVIGAGILIWLASMIWKIKKIDTKLKVHFSAKKIVALILANGGFWIFWITVCVPKAILLSHEIKFGEYLFWITVELGWLVSTSTIAFIFSRFRELLSKPQIVPVMFKLFASAFIYFAVTSVYQSILFFL